LLLREYSFLDITYSQIAEQSGLPLSSCYYYYTDKFEILQALDQQLSERFATFFDFERPEWSTAENWHQLIDLYADKCRQFLSQYPLAGDLWFKHKLPHVVSPTASRDRDIARRFELMMDTCFVLPDIPDREAVFYCAYEIFEHVMAGIWLGPLDPEWAMDQAKHAMIAYLNEHLPADLPKR